MSTNAKLPLGTEVIYTAICAHGNPVAHAHIHKKEADSATLEELIGHLTKPGVCDCRVVRITLDIALPIETMN